MVPAFFLVEAETEEKANEMAIGTCCSYPRTNENVHLVLDEELQIQDTNVPGQWITTMKGYIPGIPA